MSSRSLRHVLASIVALASVVAALPGASAYHDWEAALEGKSVAGPGDAQCPAPGPVSQAAEWARCQTNETVKAMQEYTCDVVGFGC